MHHEVGSTAVHMVGVTGAADVPVMRRRAVSRHDIDGVADRLTDPLERDAEREQGLDDAFLGVFDPVVAIELGDVEMLCHLHLKSFLLT